VRVNVEADSLNAAVLAPDVEPSSEAFGMFLANVALDMTQKTGQKCTAVRRILVPAARVEEVGAELARELGRVVVGDPSRADVRMGPLATAGQLGEVRAGIERLAENGRTLCGGPAPVGSRGYFVAPTLLVAINPDAGFVHEIEVFGPVATILPYSGVAADAVRLCNLGGGGLVSSLYSNDAAWTEEVTEGVAPWLGRVWIGSDKTAGQATAPGMVLPQSVHGGPGRAGGGEELGGMRGLAPYLQRTAVQGFQGFVAAAFGPRTGS
jgi:oxepin-CoA hydrolase/3-oxo-5,6-dehydrosuberyl-CoA semialdehyde dehydrogenase